MYTKEENEKLAVKSKKFFIFIQDTIRENFLLILILTFLVAFGFIITTPNISISSLVIYCSVLILLLKTFTCNDLNKDNKFSTNLSNIIKIIS